jgi:tetratricopeptide (TPR) repeat protein
MRVALAVLVALLAFAGHARAEKTSAEEAEPHFEIALVHYRAGKYRSAIIELEKAYGLDPTGKDLVFNLAMVYEKLGELDNAIHYLERYVALEPDPGEVEKAKDAIERLRGARAELAEGAGPRVVDRPCPPSAPPPRSEPGRFDEWVAVTGGVAVTSLLVGAVFGLKALNTQPGGDDATGPDETREELRARANNARSLARIADVAFGVAIASGSAAAILYFGRSSEVEGRGATLVGVGGRF